MKAYSTQPYMMDPMRLETRENYQLVSIGHVDKVTKHEMEDDEYEVTQFYGRPQYQQPM